MIKIKSVFKTFDGVKAVDNISMRIEKSEICVLIGPSGAGKSTLLKMINKMVIPDSGEIKINNKSVKDIRSYKLRRKIGYVIQGTGLFPHMTVSGNIKVVPKLLGWDKNKIKKRVGELLEIFKMEPGLYLDKYPHELSGGEAQRVGVARALAADPEILLMDEPFASLDPLTRKKLQSELIRIQKVLDKTIVFVTHDLEEAIKIASKTALLKNGKLIRYETPFDFLTNPDEFSEKFMGSSLLKLSGIKIKTILKPAFSVFYSENLKSFKSETQTWVVDQENKFMGYLNPDKNLRGENIKVLEKMVKNKDLFGINYNFSLKEALEIILKTGLDKLPIVDFSGVLIGEVKGLDILRIKNEFK